MLKIPNLRKMPVTEQPPRIVKIERPTRGKRLSPLKMSIIQPQSLLPKNTPKIGADDLKNRLLILQKRVMEWKSSSVP
ncbi:uncharacterized protein LOC108146673 [Drosophila elegans]|uniref:uncharacterized protein LOC108146673 n=1 Tax=Drosophila elegans TaxID=30023 RepID=UPI0007E7041E|nr:uncharacterized protein LOC108146673 [Drosophila elegans]